MKWVIAFLFFFCSPAFAGDILLLGDSISEGYSKYVHAALHNASHGGYCPFLRDGTTRANNDGNSRRLAACINLLLSRGHYRIVHFNAGMHDAHVADCDNGGTAHQVELSDYLANLQAVLDAIRASGATPIFATTTPVVGTVSCHSDADIKTYNAAAVAMMRSQGVKIDPLSSDIAEEQVSLHGTHGIHFTQEGYEVISKYVIKTLKESE